MKLLTFAHRGEAQTFIRELKLKAIPFAFDGLYGNESLLLLLTGEGPQRATEKTAAILGAYLGKIEGIINLGVCGALREDIPVGEMVSIRTIYRESDSKMEFKSFSSTDDNAKIDLITSHKRVLDIEYGKYLESFAPLVDREAWAIGSCAQTFNIPMQCYKLVSDNVLEKKKEICQVVKDMAEEFSDKLYRYYLSIEEAEVSEDSEFLISSNKNFYFTVSQMRKYKTLLDGLLIRHNSEKDILEMINVTQIEEKDILPKQRTAILLDRLFAILNPFNTTLNKKIEEAIAPLTEANCQVKFTKDYEDNNFNLMARIEHPTHLDKLKRSLNNFDYDNLVTILSGESDV